MLEPQWVRLGENGRARGINIGGEIVLAVQWRPARKGESAFRLGPLGPKPAGYYFEAGNVVRTQLLEEAHEPTEEGWARMREIAFTAYQDWLDDQGSGRD